MATPEMSDAEWRIDVANGPNAGAQVALTVGCHRVGYDPANDIVLADPAVASEHAIVDVGPAGATVIALAPGAMMQRRRLPVGRRLTLRPNAEIRLGQTVLRIAGPPASRQSASPWKAGIVALVLGIPCAGVAYWVSAPAVPHPDPTTAAQPRSDAFITAPSAASALENQLATAKLGDAVHITAADAVLVASGAVLPTDRSAWLNTQRWFDAKFGGHITLIDRVGTARDGGLPELDLAAVSMTPVPNVVTRRGDRYTIGAILQGGWSIDSITPNAVTLRLGARVMRVTL